MRYWQRRESSFLRRHYGAKALQPLPLATICRRLQRSPGSVYRKAFSLHLTREPVWTAKQVAILRQLWGARPVQEIAEQTGKSERQVRNAARCHGLQGRGKDWRRKIMLERMAS